ncbi:MAG: hypothetical protein H6891_01445 [Brucellaceae bacterium]|nr:hypothetical protein [Brucellaceae bacterium]
MSTVQILREWMLEHYGTTRLLPALLVANAAIAHSARAVAFAPPPALLRRRHDAPAG